MPPDTAIAPIQITLYDEHEEVKETYSRSRVPWGILKKAIRLSKLNTDLDKISAEDIDAIAGLVVEIFGDQFTIAELDKGADVSEMMTVLQAIVTRASRLVKANPTVPPAKPKRQKH